MKKMTLFHKKKIQKPNLVPVYVLLTNLNLILAMLNGELKLSQNEKAVKPTSVSTDVLLDQKLEIRSEDLDSIRNATSIAIHWFVDCQYVRETKEFSTQEIFTEPNKTHRIEALVEASFEPIPTKSVPTLTSKLIADWRTQHKAELPYICHNKSKVAADPNKIYGHFTTNITVYGNWFSEKCVYGFAPSTVFVMINLIRD